MAQTQTYEITGPDGVIYEIQSDHQPTRMDVSAALTAMQARDQPPRNSMGLTKAIGIGPEPGMLERMGNAVGPTIRGAGDAVGANWLLESSGLVDQGRLTGNEATARDAATRQAAGVGGGAMMLGQTGQFLADTARRGGARAAATAAGTGILIPQAKYWAVKTALMHAGIPPVLAEMAAVAASGYHGKGKPPAEPMPSAAPPEPSGPVPPTPGRVQAQPGESPRELTRRLRMENRARQTAEGLDPRISGLPPGETPAPSVSGPQGVPASAVAPNASDRAAVMTAANPRATPPEPIPEVPKTPRAKRSAAAAPPPAATPATAGPSMSSLEASLVAESGLSRQEARQALKWLEQGIPPEQIQQRIVDSRALMESPTFANLPTPEEPSAATRRGRPAPMSPALPPSEQMIYDALINRGKTPAEALAHLEAARTLSGRLGTPSVERMVDRTELRNKTGRWPPE